MVLHPEGVERVQPGGSTGFNPGETVPRRRALKGRQVERTNKGEGGSIVHVSVVRSNSCTSRCKIHRLAPRPFRANRIF
jgi:hypothetical protein